MVEFSCTCSRRQVHVKVSRLHWELGTDLLQKLDDRQGEPSVGTSRVWAWEPLPAGSRAATWLSAGSGEPASSLSSSRLSWFS